MKEKILTAISEASLEKILDFNDVNEVEWIWINRGVFKDILTNLGFEEVAEDELEKHLEKIQDDEIFKLLEKAFKNKGYLPMNQFLFSTIEKGFKPTKDIETIIFIKEKLYTKTMIKIMNEYNWILKAMAIDTYLRMATQYNTFKETYKELFEENSRIIETVLSDGEHSYLTGRWRFERKTKELVFYKQEEIFKSWGEGEAEARFGEFRS